MKQPGKPSWKPSRPEQGRHMGDEADIGSGEKTPGQQETEDLIRQITPLPEPAPADRGRPGAPARRPPS